MAWNYGKYGEPPNQSLGDWWNEKRQATQNDPVWGSRVQGSNAQKLGLEPFVPWTNAVGYGIGNSMNDIINTFSPSPEYREAIPIHGQDQSRPIYEPQEGGQEAVSTLTRYGLDFTLPFGALSAAGLPMLASFPLSGAAAGYNMNPAAEGYDLVQALPAPVQDMPGFRDVVPVPEDSGHTRRVKRALQGLVTGGLIDLPAAAAGSMALPAGMAGYMGIPMAAEAVAGNDYETASTRTLRGMAFQNGDIDAMQELAYRGDHQAQSIIKQSRLNVPEMDDLEWR